MPDSVAAANTLETEHVVPGQNGNSHPYDEPVDALDRLRDDLRDPSGDWRMAVLTAIGRWTIAAEVVDGERNEYLIGGEAFDWKLLAQRLHDDAGVGSKIPTSEWRAWISDHAPFAGLEEDEFRRVLGVDKYRGHLSYFYGVTVEQGLLTAVGEEIAKGRVAGGRAPDQATRDDVFVRLYGSPQKPLWDEYKASLSAGNSGLGERLNGKPNLNVMDGFTYWLFKLRMERADPARVASDTRKGLAQLERMRQAEERRARMLRRSGNVGRYGRA